MDARCVITLLLGILQLSDIFCKEFELLNELFDSKKYSAKVRPKKHPNEKVKVNVELEVHFISALEWHDDYLHWNASEFDGIEKFIVPPDRVWLPDFAIINSAGGVYDSLFTSHFRVHLESTGLVVWMFGGTFATTCQLDLTYFPFDKQKCNLTIENWAYPSTQVDLFNSTDKVHKDDFHENGEWSFSDSNVQKEYMQHDVYKNTQFPKITFNIFLERKPGYYLLNIVTPCLMIIALALFMFWLPADSGEKVSLGITVLLAFSVFQLVIADNMPKTSDFTPLLSMYVAFIMGISCVSTILAIFTLYLHFKVTTKRPNRILRIICFNGLARFFCMTVPDTGTIRCSPTSSDADLSEKDPNAFSNGGYTGETKVEKMGEDIPKPALPDTSASYLHEIASHIRYLRNKMKDKEQAEEVAEEWRALARVIDRACFWVSLLIITGVCCQMFVGSALHNK